jgi:hypothetical protein
VTTTDRLRRWALYLLLYGVAPLLLLTLLESVLRTTGYGESTEWLLERHCDNATFHSPNPAFYQQFSAIPLYEIMNWDELEFVVPAEKSANTFRIFAFGESALYGQRSAVRILEVMLAARFPDIKFEVFNASCPGMNSHVLRAAARVAAQHQPDLFLIYMGNNEAVGPYGPNTLIGRTGVLWNPTVIQGLISLSNLRLTQFAGRDSVGAPTQEEIMASVPGQANFDGVQALYADNLEAMLASARSAGATTVLCTLAANVRFGDKPVERPASLDAIERGAVSEVVLAAAKRHADARVILADVERRLYEQSPSGVPDYTFFSDNIHLQFDGAYQAACAMFEGAAMAVFEAGAYVAPLSRNEAADLLGWNAATEIELLRIQVGAGFDPHSKQLLQQQLIALEAANAGDLVTMKDEGFARAIAARPDDVLLYHMRFENLLYANRTADALKVAEEMATKFPCSRLALRALGKALNASAQIDAAQDAYGSVLEIYPDDIPSQVSMGLRK